MRLFKRNLMGEVALRRESLSCACYVFITYPVPILVAPPEVVRLGNPRTYIALCKLPKGGKNRVRDGDLCLLFFQ